MTPFTRLASRPDGESGRRHDRIGVGRIHGQDAFDRQNHPGASGADDDTAGVRRGGRPLQSERVVSPAYGEPRAPPIDAIRIEIREPDDLVHRLKGDRIAVLSHEEVDQIGSATGTPGPARRRSADHQPGFR
jgi:hypothetical protein